MTKKDFIRACWRGGYANFFCANAYAESKPCGYVFTNDDFEAAYHYAEDKRVKYHSGDTAKHLDEYEKDGDFDGIHGNKTEE